MDIWDDEFDDIAIDEDEIEQLEAENEQAENAAFAAAQANQSERKTVSSTASPVSESKPVSAPEPSPMPEPEPEPVSAPEPPPISEPEPEPISASEPPPISEPEPEPESDATDFDDWNLFDDDEPEETPVSVQPAPAPSPASEIPEQKTTDLSDLFDDDEDEQPASLFSGMTVPTPAPAPAPIQKPIPASQVMTPGAVEIPQKEQEVNIDFLNGSDDEEDFSSSVSPFGGVIKIPDPDKIEMLPSDWAVYSRIPQKSGHAQPAEWLAQMKDAMPSNAMLQQMLDIWLAEKSEIFSVLKLPSLREPKSSWKVSDILQDRQVLNELYARSPAVWKETLLQSQGNETSGWLEKVWLTKLLQYAVNYFMICMK